MSLEGKDQKLLVKEPCIFAYVNDEEIYYLTAGKEKKLMRMKEENDRPQLIIKGDLIKTIVQDDFVFYMDTSAYLYRYNTVTKEKLRLHEFPIKSYNVDDNNIYLLDEEKGVCRSDLDGSNLTVLREASDWDRSIQIIGDYLFIGDKYELWKIKKDASEYNKLYEQW